MDYSQKEIYVAIISIATFIIFILLLFIFFVVITQQKVLKLQRRLVGAEIISTEKERERISMELHDSLGPKISSIIIFNQLVKPEDDRSRELLKTMDVNLRQVSADVRNLSKGIIPRFYDERTVESIIKRAVEDFGDLEDQPLEIEFQFQSVAMSELGNDERLNLYRIVQELLTNIYRHSKASKVWFTTKIKANRHIIHVMDNGKGYNVNQNHSGLGIRHILNRVTLLNAEYTVESSPEVGTRHLLIMKRNDAK